MAYVVSTDKKIRILHFSFLVSLKLVSLPYVVENFVVIFNIPSKPFQNSVRSKGISGTFTVFVGTDIKEPF